MEGFAEIARRAVEPTGAGQLLASGPATVFERIARGGGATRWYWLRTADDLGRLYDVLSPGSVVSFYFDDRIEGAPFSEEIGERILATAESDGDAVVGRLAPDGLTLDVDYVGGPIALAELVDDLPADETVFFGPVPGRDNDGVHAVTVTLPDADGVVRAHPH